MHVVHLDYRISNVCGYIAGLINSFFWNRYWTFKSGGPVAVEGFLFLAVFGVCYGLQFLALLLLVEKLHVSENLSQPLALVVYTGFNFLLNKLITFRKRKEE
jgi:putative flippase GtrA